MTLPKSPDIQTTAATTLQAVEWPHHIIRPTDLMQNLKHKTQLHLMRSPIYSKIVLQVVGSWAYLLAHFLNKSKVFNIETFNEELKKIEINNSDDENKIKQTFMSTKISQQSKAPLLTLSNHISCIDDPVLWASLLPLTYYSTNTNSVRWSAAAVEICFSKPWHSAFFSLGKTYPIVRGVGLNQVGMDFALALLNCNQWLHLFPEGRVMRDDKQQKITNQDRGYIFKWGISKLILDYLNKCSTTSSYSANTISEKTIRILPFYHLGLDEILPIGWPYIPRFGKQITIYIRPTVIDMNLKLLSDILKNRSINNQSFLKSKCNDTIKRIKLTNYLEEEVEKLIPETTRLHQN